MVSALEVAMITQSLPAPDAARVRRSIRWPALGLAAIALLAGTGTPASAQTGTTLVVHVKERALSPSCGTGSVNVTSRRVAPGKAVCFEIVITVAGLVTVASGAGLIDVAVTDDSPLGQAKVAVISNGVAGASSAPGCKESSSTTGGAVITCTIDGVPRGKDGIVTVTATVPANAAAGTRYKNTVKIVPGNMDEVNTARSRLTASATVIAGGEVPSSATRS
ncbi:MAG TPA: hypothetical protein VME46_26560 [Acidimicrobiales bacterium]|nr:hypothetical protein [Acidimicrobiales bacterium]